VRTARQPPGRVSAQPPRGASDAGEDGLAPTRNARRWRCTHARRGAPRGARVTHGAQRIARSAQRTRTRSRRLRTRARVRTHQRRQAVAVVLAAVVVHQLVLQQVAHLLERAAWVAQRERTRCQTAAAKSCQRICAFYAPLRRPAMVSTSGAGTNSWFFMPISTATSVRHASCARACREAQRSVRRRRRVVLRCGATGGACLLHVAQLVHVELHGGWTATTDGPAGRLRTDGARRLL
jgi:hypothetical protein